MKDHEVVLGSPWLRKHNPSINWKTREIILDQCEYKGTKLSTLKREDAFLGIARLCVVSKRLEDPT